MPALFSTLLHSGASIGSILILPRRAAAGGLPANSRAAQGPIALNHTLQLPPGIVRARSRSRAQQGEGNIKFLIVLVILGAIAYVCFKMVPPYVNNYQLEDTCVAESRMFAAHQKTEDRVRAAVFSELQGLGINVPREAVKVEILGHRVRVSVDYTVVVNVFGADINLQFNPSGESPII